MLVPRTPHPGIEWQVEPFFWAAVMLSIAGYWSARSRSRVTMFLVVAFALVAQVVTPLSFSVAEQSPLGWAMLAGGLILGLIAGRRFG